MEILKPDRTTGFGSYRQTTRRPCAKQGDPKAADELLPLVYGELRKLAAYKMAHSAAGHTLQPTALVHEVWMRLVGTENPTFENRAHFFAAAAEAMRHLLIDNARRKLARRHGGGLQRVNVENVDLALPADEDHLLAVNDALDRLASSNPVVRLRSSRCSGVGVPVRSESTDL